MRKQEIAHELEAEETQKACQEMHRARQDARHGHTDGHERP